MLHRFAIEAEMEGRWDRADFFWQELQAKLAQPQFRTDLAETLSSPTTPARKKSELEPGEVYRHLVNEVFIDTHCAFYNSYSQQTAKTTPKSRQFAHLGYVTRLLDLSGASQDEQFQLVGEATEDRIRVCCDAGDWNQAVELASGLLKRFPDRLHYQEMKASLEFGRATHKLKNSESESANLSDADRVAPAIKILEEMCEKYPSTVAPYELAGRLHRLRAVKLANGGKLSEALLEIEKAAAYYPGLESLGEDRAKLGEMMQNLQKQVRAVLASIAARPNASLNYKGKQLKREADRGLGPALAYQKSEQAKAIGQRAESAQLRTIWRRIGLAEPADRWDERASRLISALSRIIEGKPEHMTAVERFWKSLAEGEPDLAALDYTPIRSFLRDRLFPGVAATPESRPIAAPILPVPTAGRRSKMPFGYWLFNGKDLRIKLQSALALALLLLASTLTVRDMRRARARESAWSQVQQASLKGDDFGVVTGCEAFFSAVPRNEDPRTQEARALYQGAIVRWFSRLPGKPDGNALSHIERYRDLMKEGGPS
jgi:hypothetical protein